MKVSIYNTFFFHENSFVGYNALQDKFIILVQELYELYNAAIIEKNIPRLNPNSAIEKKEYFSILISNCVAVEKNKR